MSGMCSETFKFFMLGTTEHDAVKHGIFNDLITLGVRDRNDDAVCAFGSTWEVFHRPDLVAGA